MPSVQNISVTYYTDIKIIQLVGISYPKSINFYKVLTVANFSNLSALFSSEAIGPSFPLMASIISRAANFTSPQIPTSTFFDVPILRPSASTWLFIESQISKPATVISIYLFVQVKSI